MESIKGIDSITFNIATFVPFNALFASRFSDIVVPYMKIPYFWKTRTEYIVKRDLSQYKIQDWVKFGYDAEKGELVQAMLDNLSDAEAVRMVLDVYKGSEKVKDKNLFDAAIVNSSYHGYTNSAMLLLEDGRANPASHKNSSILWASELHYEEIVELLMHDPRVSTESLNEALEKSIPQSKYSLPHGTYIRMNNPKSWDTFKLISKNLRVNPGTNYNAALVRAAELGNVKIVSLLVSDKRINPAYYHNGSVRVATENGHVNVVKELLKDPRVDPFSRQYGFRVSEIYGKKSAFAIAVSKGNANIVKLFLAHPGVDTYDQKDIKPSDVNDKRVSILLSNDPHFGTEFNELLTLAIIDDDVAEVKKLLKDPRVDPSARNNDAVVVAVYKGNEEIVELLLQDPRVDPAANDSASIIMAALHGGADIVKLLLRDSRIDPSAHYNEAVYEALSEGYINVVIALIEDSRIGLSVKNFAMKEAVAKNYIELVKHLLKDPRVDPNVGDELEHCPLYVALFNGYTEIVKALVSDPRVTLDHIKREGYLIYRVSSEGYDEIIEMLMNAPELDKELKMSILRGAISGLHFDIIRRLMNDSDLNTTEGWSAGLAWLTYTSGAKEIKDYVNWFLNNPMTDPTYKESQALLFAVSYGDPAVVRLLLEDGRADPTADNSKILFRAIGRKSVDIIRMLLEDGRVDPSARDSQAINKASRFGNADIVKMLLDDPRVDLTGKGAQSLITAVQSGSTDVVRVLLEDGRVDPALDDYIAVHEAKLGGNQDIMDMLNIYIDTVNI